MSTMVSSDGDLASKEIACNNLSFKTSHCSSIEISITRIQLPVAEERKHSYAFREEKKKTHQDIPTRPLGPLAQPFSNNLRSCRRPSPASSMSDVITNNTAAPGVDNRSISDQVDQVLGAIISHLGTIFVMPMKIFGIIIGIMLTVTFYALIIGGIVAAVTAVAYQVSRCIKSIRSQRPDETKDEEMGVLTSEDAENNTATTDFAEAEAAEEAAAAEEEDSAHNDTRKIAQDGGNNHLYTSVEDGTSPACSGTERE